MISSLFTHIPLAPADPILGVTEAFRADSHPSKVNLGVGIYQDAHGKAPILNVVKQAAGKWIGSEDTKAYMPIEGLATYNSAVQELLFGKDAAVVKNKQVATVQAVGGSGGLKLALDFIKRFYTGSKLYISDPSWENHRALGEAAGYTVEHYPYYDPHTNGLKSSEMLDTLRGLPAHTVVLLHACCHNPTGVDLDRETWQAVATICAEQSLIALIDCAYQGFGDGLDEDAYAIRLFAEKGLTFLVASSFSKSFGMYRERVGALSIVTSSASETTNVMTQLRRVVRSIYSSPPSYGAQLISIVLHTPELRQEWEREVSEMRNRIHQMRELFSSKLATSAAARDFSFILKQKGMFSYSGLSQDIIEALRERFHIYALTSGRICVAAMNHSNVDYISNSIATILSERPA